jgi:hypothetical protein
MDRARLRSMDDRGERPLRRPPRLQG